MGTNHICGTADRFRRCQFSSLVSVINFWWSSDNCWSHPPSISVLFTIWCDTEYLAFAGPLRRAGLSAAAETLVSITITRTFAHESSTEQSNVLAEILREEKQHAGPYTTPQRRRPKQGAWVGLKPSEVWEGASSPGVWDPRTAIHPSPIPVCMAKQRFVWQQCPACC